MRVCVFMCLSRSTWCHSQITFPSLCAHVFIAIRHDVISPGPEQSYLSGRSWPARGAPNPVLLTPMHDLFCYCLSLIKASQLWPRHTEPSNQSSGWGASMRVGLVLPMLTRNQSITIKVIAAVRHAKQSFKPKVMNSDSQNDPY